MQITLEQVRLVLRQALGFDSFTAGFITEVHEDSSQPTAGITKDGRLAYSPDFVQQNVACREDLFSLLFHEILHPMFGHFIHGGGMIENIAADAVINATISTLYPKPSQNGSLFKKVLAPTGLSGLLRPESKMESSRYSRIYDRLYPNYQTHEEQPMSTGELIQTLKILIPKQPDPVTLLGSHQPGSSGDNGLADLPAETLARIAEDIKRSVRNGTGKQAGRGDTLLGILMEALKTHLSIRKVLLQKFATKRKIDRFKETLHAHRACTSPLPLQPSKRDLVLLSAGIYPFHYHNQVAAPKTQNRGLAIYLDVSGSVNDHLPAILGILSGLKREITTVFQFSNKVVEVPFDRLLQGKIQTTWGTDFDCVANSILERGFERAVIITDGYATMQPDLQAQLKKQHFQGLTVLFGDTPNAESLASLGPVVELADICD